MVATIATAIAIAIIFRGFLLESQACGAPIAGRATFARVASMSGDVGDASTAGRVGTRARCSAEDAVVEIFKEHVKTPLAFDSAGPISSDKQAFMSLAKSNKTLLVALHRQQANMCFGKSFMKNVLLKTAGHNQDAWGFVDSDVAKFAGDTVENACGLFSRIGKALRQRSIAKWARTLLDLDDPAQAKLEINYFVGWDMETKSAWRVADGSAEKEYTQTFEEPEEPDDMDEMLAVWGTWTHPTPNLTVLQYKEMQQGAKKISTPTSATGRWFYATGEGAYIAKVGNLTHAGKSYKTVLLTAPDILKEKQVCQIPAGDLEKAEIIAQGLRRDLLDGKIEGTNLPVELAKVDEVRMALRKERDIRLAKSGELCQPVASGAACRKRPAAAMERKASPTTAPNVESKNLRTDDQLRVMGVALDEFLNMEILQSDAEEKEEEEEDDEVVSLPEGGSFDMFLKNEDVIARLG